MTKTFFDFPETYMYYTSCIYIPIPKTEEKCADQLSYGFNIQDKLEGCTHEKKIPLWVSGFLEFCVQTFSSYQR